MKPVSFDGGLDKVPCLGAHCDDFEIGCGSTELQLAALNPKAEATAARPSRDRKDRGFCLT